MGNVNSAGKRSPESGNNLRVAAVVLTALVLGWALELSCQEIKEPDAAGTFYPADPGELSRMVDALIESVNPPDQKGEIFALIVPHAGYGYSGKVAASAYKLVKGQPYRTVVVIAPSHYHDFEGVRVYPEGAFRTPLGDLEIDKEFTAKLLYQDSAILAEPEVFEKEHTPEVQLPFLQRTLKDFKIVVIIMARCDFSACEKLASLLKQAIAERKDVLVVASTDMYHGYDYQEAEIIDQLTVSSLKAMDARALYEGLESEKIQLCGGMPVVTTLILARDLGHDKIEILDYTNSALVTGDMKKGQWTVGYTSCVIDQEKSQPQGGQGEANMLNKEQRKKLLKVARSSIETYLKSGQRPELKESDQAFLKKMGAFVTLHDSEGNLRGCIGNMIGQEPLYLTVRDMAIEAAVGDPRFAPLEAAELPDTTIEISVLSPMERIDNADKIKMGVHGVQVRKGWQSGVFLPQVASETGWSKEEFLSQLCYQKAGLAPDAWKDKDTELYIFSAEVFSEKEY